MEPLPGRTLQQALNVTGHLPVHQVTTLGLRLLEVLQATHRAGIVHGDVKPANVHLCGGGRVVLTDFGIACAIGDACSATGTFPDTPGIRRTGTAGRRCMRAGIRPVLARRDGPGPVAGHAGFATPFATAAEQRQPGSPSPARMRGPPSIVSSGTAAPGFRRSSDAMPICVLRARSRLSARTIPVMGASRHVCGLDSVHPDSCELSRMSGLGRRPAALRTSPRGPCQQAPAADSWKDNQHDQQYETPPGPRDRHRPPPRPRSARSASARRQRAAVRHRWRGSPCPATRPQHLPPWSRAWRAATR